MMKEEASIGTKIAAIGREKCNKLTQDERARLMADGLKRIRKGARRGMRKYASK